LGQTLHQLVLISEHTELVAENQFLEPPDVALSPRRFYWIKADVKYEAALYPCYSM